MVEPAARDTAFMSTSAESAGDGVGLCVPQWQTTDWSMLFSYAELVRVPRGTLLIEKDALERTLYFVASGLLEVTSILGGASTAASAIVHPGEVVGELSFLDGQPRSATVWAIADSELYRLHFNQYEAFANAHPHKMCDLLLALGRVVSLRLRRTEAQRARV